jgi:OOP family OmpA-OmpF porin
VALERSLTIRSLRWRAESLRTGRPFSEVALLRTLVYRVEQVFLIHTSTSLVLQHLVEPSLPDQLADQIAAMLAAIEAFGREAFGPLPPEAHLRRFELGELTVWISHDPSLMLAAVVRGTPSVAIADQLSDTLFRVHVRCSAALREFAGDVSGFDTSRPLLEPLLRTERRPPARWAQGLLPVLAALLVAGLVGLLAWAHVRAATEERDERAYRAAMASEPGIVLNQVTWHRGHAYLSGFRDPLARSPEALVAARGLPPPSFDLEPYVSIDPQIVERRANLVLQPPPSVRLSVIDGRLQLSGTAPRAWLQSERLLARAVPGVEAVDDGALIAEESLGELLERRAALESKRVVFPPGVSRIQIADSAWLSEIAGQAREAMAAAQEARVGACLVVTGYGDIRGTAERNTRLGADRASAVADRIAAQGVDPAFQRHVGAGARTIDPTLARNVVFRLDVNEADPRSGCGGGP